MAATKAQELAARLRGMTDDELAAFGRKPRRFDPEVNVAEAIVAEHDLRAAEAATQIRCADCGYTTAKFNGYTFAADACPTPGQPNMLHKWEAVTHTEAFAGFVAQRNAERAATVTVSWRKVDAQTGGGYSGLASTGVRVYARKAPLSREGLGWEYGRMNGTEREVGGYRPTLTAAKLAAEALCGKTSTATAAATPATADPKKEGTMPAASATTSAKTSALDLIVLVLGEAGKTLDVPTIIGTVEKRSDLHEKTIYGALYSNARRKDGALVDMPAKREFKLNAAGKARYKALTDTPAESPEPAAEATPDVQPDPPADPPPPPAATEATPPAKKVGVQVEADPKQKTPRKRASRAKAQVTA